MLTTTGPAQQSARIRMRGGPATVFGCDSFATIQGGINGVRLRRNGNRRRRHLHRESDPGQASDPARAHSLASSAADARRLNRSSRRPAERCLRCKPARAIQSSTASPSRAARGESSQVPGPLNNLQIRNNRVIAFTGNGVFLNDPGTDITIHQNSIDGGSKTGGGGLFHLDQDSVQRLPSHK